MITTRSKGLLFVLGSVAAALAGVTACNRSPDVKELNYKLAGATDPNLTTLPANAMKATFAAGCFWGVEATFRQTPGVLMTAVGYTGGTTSKPTYEDVCTDGTGHAEAVEIEYDPSRVTYEKLLEVFWANHNPTTLNRQGPDVGTQYRSAIFYHTPEQKAAAEKSKTAVQAHLSQPIVTQILPAVPFYRAEEYHQQYLEKRGLSHCHL